MVDATQDSLPSVPEEAKKGSLVATLGAVVGLSVAAVGVGYVMGGMIRTQDTAGMAAGDTANSGDAGTQGHGDTSHGGAAAGGEHGAASEAAGATIIMEPIIVTLPRSDNSWLRLEIAIVVGEGKSSPSEALRAQILAQISAYLRTTEMAQVYGPSGYMHLHEDILDIARRVTEGAVADVLILTLVAE